MAVTTFLAVISGAIAATAPLDHALDLAVDLGDVSGALARVRELAALPELAWLEWREELSALLAACEAEAAKRARCAVM